MQFNAVQFNAVRFNVLELNASECLFLETEEREKCVSVAWVFIIFRIQNTHTHTHTLHPNPSVHAQIEGTLATNQGFYSTFGLADLDTNLDKNFLQSCKTLSTKEKSEIEAG